MDRDTLIGITKEFFDEVLGNGRYDLIYDIIHEEHTMATLDTTIEWAEPKNAHQNPDHYEALIEVIQYIKDGLPDFHVDVEQMVVEGNTLAAVTKHHGTHLGAMDGYPPTGLDVKYDAFWYLEFKDNKILRIKYVVDTLTLFHTLGKAIIDENNKEKVKQYIAKLRKMGIIPSD